MDQMIGADGGFPLEDWFLEMPICTRWWTVATIATSALVQFQMITPYQLFYSFRTVFHKSQVSDKESIYEIIVHSLLLLIWKLITNTLYELAVLATNNYFSLFWAALA